MISEMTASLTNPLADKYLCVSFNTVTSTRSSLMLLQTCNDSDQKQDIVLDIDGKIRSAINDKLCAQLRTWRGQHYLGQAECNEKDFIFWGDDVDTV